MNQPAVFPPSLSDAVDPANRERLIRRAKQLWASHMTWERRAATWRFPFRRIALHYAEQRRDQWDQLVLPMMSAGIHPIYEGRTVLITQKGS